MITAIVLALSLLTMPAAPTSAPHAVPGTTNGVVTCLNPPACG